jgi:hypothetical protein
MVDGEVHEEIPNEQPIHGVVHLIGMEEELAPANALRGK